MRPAMKAVIEVREEHEPIGDGAQKAERISGIESIDPTRNVTPVPNTDSPVMRELGLRSGAMVDGIYRIVRPLGAGGMGVVTLAHDERLERLVAIAYTHHGDPIGASFDVTKKGLHLDLGSKRALTLEARRTLSITHAQC